MSGSKTQPKLRVIASLALLSLLLLSLSGCGKEKKEEFGGFIGGSSGLAINVVEGAPPRVIEGGGLTEFAVLMTIQNLGETAVGPGTDNPLVVARLAGISPPAFGLTPENVVVKYDKEIQPTMRHVDGSVTQGEITDVIFDNLAYKPVVSKGSLDIDMRLEICYDYETHATAKFCMNKNTAESKEDRTVCSLRGPRVFGNSGAPVHISNVQQNPLSSDKIQFVFDIDHVGSGTFFLRNTPKDNFDSCVFSDIDPNINRIEVTIEPLTPDNYLIECLGFDEPLDGGGVRGVVIEVPDQQLKVRCVITRTTPTQVRVFEDLLNIKLSYRYGQYLTVPLTIQNSMELEEDYYEEE